MARRTQAERSDATTAGLITAAQELFGRDGYAATSIDAVAAAAGMTKGAAYHHFQSKAALLRAVFVRQQEEIAAELERVAAEEPDVRAALRRGVRTFLERCLDPAFRRIVLLDGPAVLGWDTVRAIEYDHVLRVLSAGIAAVAAQDAQDAEDTEGAGGAGGAGGGGGGGGAARVRAQMLFGAVCEAGMLLARSPAPRETFETVLAEAERLLAAAMR
ncbi:TetR/AcrR family transcriptional regulator [Actinomadura sp. 21ATH]|uniref:TetR/AcrR family transcriptional regulator n=1 Tax=Actinomadura sp. 21ATH TaxID=1735444 RepID=UPI0035C1FFBF